MSHLTTIISGLTKSERAAFSLHCRNRAIPDRIIKLFEYFCALHSPDADASQIKKTKRKPRGVKHLSEILEREIEEYIILQRRKVDVSGISPLMGLVSLAHYWCEKDAVQLAGAYLSDAEKLGKEMKDYAGLESVYRMMYAHAHELGMDSTKLLKEWKDNSEQLEQDREVLFALNQTEEKVHKAKVGGDSVNANAIVHYALHDFELPPGEENNPLFMLPVAMMIRSAMLSKKQYRELLEFIEPLYLDMKKNGAFDGAQAKFELSFLYMVAHAHYRNVKLKTAKEYTDKMKELLPTEVFRSSRYYGKYIALKASIDTYTGENDSAIELLENVHKDKTQEIGRKEILNIRLNLVVNYFNRGDYRMAIKRMEHISIPKKELEKIMGLEWCFKYDMINMIVQYENGHPNALYLNKVIMKYYQGMMTKEQYQRALAFLECIRMIMLNPQVVSTQKFLEKVQGIEKARNGEIEDLQALTFFAWILSKMEKRPYYTVLINKVNWIREKISGDL